MFALDPVARQRNITWRDLLVLSPLALFAAVGAHVVFTAVVWSAGALLGVEAKDEVETVKVVVVQQVEQQPEPKVEPEKPEPKPEPELEAAPKPKPKPKPKPAAEPPPEPKVEPTKPAPPSKIVGLNLGSTVPGGSGPSFATGDDLMGATESVARDPRIKTDTSKDTPVEKATPNRTATRIPQEGVKLVKPTRRSRVKPVYPPELRAQGIEGNVVVQVRLGPTGQVLDVEIVSPSPYAEMNTQALAAARRESFSPATRDGVPIEFTLSYTIRFRLSES